MDFEGNERKVGEPTLEEDLGVGEDFFKEEDWGKEEG